MRLEDVTATDTDDTYTFLKRLESAIAAIDQRLQNHIELSISLPSSSSSSPFAAILLRVGLCCVASQPQARYWLEEQADKNVSTRNVTTLTYHSWTQQ